MLDHICIGVADYQKARDFYEKVLPTLGYGIMKEHENFGGFGRDGKPSFWIGQGAPGFYWDESHGVGRAPIHVAFTAGSREQVDEFYKAALAAGGKDYGAPGVREIYHPHYYGAFIIDLDGNNIEAVCHKPA